ncbi:DUF1697 domain-containing protein [Solitalea koreensis]|uniref:Uncharacterized conserved protein, DUF1697 family n=1 Tax=Solitalea koreensis TaxID=543615 RepID=A0A521E7K2_9SPHI|nr:DUF1697 domain-containing protein [Solitalea koreensis]SMO79924.1 Uncharacterized conserved protein, DUF1697 family [Solitalea koreensis]
METIISILRGINVSGHKKVPMAELKALYEDLNFKTVQTYIQSGNVVFKSEQSNDLSMRIEQKIFEQFDFHVPVLTLTVSELQKVVEENPFLNQKDVDPDKLHVTFLTEQPKSDNLEKLKNINYEPDRFIISGKTVYLSCPEGYGNTKLNNTFFENKLKVTATTRNWKTVNKLYEIAQTI